jgi:hypothetical protein
LIQPRCPLTEQHLLKSPSGYSTHKADTLFPISRGRTIYLASWNKLAVIAKRAPPAKRILAQTIYATAPGNEAHATRQFGELRQ